MPSKIEDSNIRKVNPVEVLLAGILLNRNNPLALHHIKAIQEYLNCYSDKELKEIILSGMISK
jgi:hypothetical protein